jgi:peptidoglycan/xylan/chitin deacetylase (PgdA/CDA1 family)
MKNLRIIAYHKIVPIVRDPLSVSTQEFINHLRFFMTKGWNFLTLKEVYEQYISRDLKPVNNTIVITFDDGYANNYKYAFPILKSYGIKATIFLVVDHIGKQKNSYKEEMAEEDLMLNWDQIHEMRDYGIEFGSHTLTHPFLTKITPDIARKEIYESKLILDKQLSQNTVSFCYPSGDLNTDICNIVKDVGYKVGVVTPPRPRIKESVFTLKRIGLYNTDTYLTFRLKNSSIFNIMRESRALKIVKGIRDIIGITQNITKSQN